MSLLETALYKFPTKQFVRNLYIGIFIDGIELSSSNYICGEK
jgi:hypothetical protein